MTHYYKIAGLTVAMDSFGKTSAQAEPYLCEPTEPDIRISSAPETLRTRQPHLSLESCEYLCTGASFYHQLLRFDGLMLHASAVVLDGRAYLFSAPCGTGKSTHTGLWKQVFGSRAKILNDDKPALRLEEGVWYAYGTPWSGKQDISLNTRAPLAGICFLHQAPENAIAPYTGTGVIHDLLAQTPRPRDPELLVQLMRLLDRLITGIPIWQMGCNMDPAAAIVSCEAMSGMKKEQTP